MNYVRIKHQIEATRPSKVCAKIEYLCPEIINHRGFKSRHWKRDVGLRDQTKRL